MGEPLPSAIQLAAPARASSSPWSTRWSNAARAAGSQHCASAAAWGWRWRSRGCEGEQSALPALSDQLSAVGFRLFVLGSLALSVLAPSHVCTLALSHLALL